MHIDALVTTHNSYNNMIIIFLARMSVFFATSQWVDLYLCNPSTLKLDKMNKQAPCVNFIVIDFNNLWNGNIIDYLS